VIDVLHASTEYSIFSTAADLLEALSSALAQAEKERDEARGDLAVAEEQYLQGTQEEIQYAKNMREERDSALSQLAEARGEMERLSKPSTIFAGIDFSMGESKSSWGCTCGRWGKTQFALYEGCTRAECPGRRPSPPSEKGEGK